MRSISMPDLPAGLRRRLVIALFSYYGQAGSPPLTAFEGRISAEHELPGTVSKETVRRMLVGLNVPLRWEMAHAVFVALRGMAGHDPESPDCDEYGPAHGCDAAGVVPPHLGRSRGGAPGLRSRWGVLAAGGWFP